MGPGAMTTDGVNIYWIDVGTVNKIPAAGGSCVYWFKQSNGSHWIVKIAK